MLSRLPPLIWYSGGVSAPMRGGGHSSRLMVWEGPRHGSVGFWKVRIVQKTTELRGLLLLPWREVALLDDLDHLIKRTPPDPLACSPRPEGRAASALCRPPDVIYHRSHVQARIVLATLQHG